jgi:hypothetical protein
MKWSHVQFKGFKAVYLHEKSQQIIHVIIFYTISYKLII